ncbi:unnamed protein product [Jaminaea pallidilutea]
MRAHTLTPKGDLVGPLHHLQLVACSLPHAGAPEYACPRRLQCRDAAKILFGERMEPMAIWKRRTPPCLLTVLQDRPDFLQQHIAITCIDSR